MSKVTLEIIKNHALANSLIESANDSLGKIGYTEHGFRHCNLVAKLAYQVLNELKYPPDYAELGAVAGFLHDIGNVVSRYDHGQSSAFLALSILESLDTDPKDIAEIISAIGNHEEENGDPVNPLSAALILADKSDVHRSRVRNPQMIKFDIHDRVNYAAKKSVLKVDSIKKTISLELNIDTEISQVMEYFEIFISRMIMCRRAAKLLDHNFELIINERKLL